MPVKSDGAKIAEAIDGLASRVRDVAHGDVHGPAGLEALAMALSGQQLGTPVGTAIESSGESVASGLESVATSIDNLASALWKIAKVMEDKQGV